MKRLTYICLLSFALFSCNNAEEKGSSTPIDTTNLQGTAPATYGADDPATQEAPVYEGNMDTSLKANTASSEDSAKKRK